MSVLRLAVPTPLRRLFDYLPPAELSEQELAGLKPGIRVRVPFGRRELIAILVDVAEQSTVPTEQLKAALEILDSEALLPQSLQTLCHWSSDYYQHPIGEVFSAALPKRLRKGLPVQEQGEAAWQLSDRGKGLPEGALPRSPKQAAALALLQQQTQVSTATMKAQGISTAVLRSLREKSLIEACTMPIAPQAGISREGLPLNDDQRQAVEGIAATLGEFQCHLLEGVTGSGKTEVYLQLISHCLAQGLQALVLVPEIGLSPQTLDRFRERFDAHIVVLHSGLAEGQRYRAWEAARSGAAHIVIGTRSAVFTPLAKPGLIVVDEEHDSSYKQQDGFRYSARDLSIKRGQLHNCPVVLGSATPALESLHNAQQGRYWHFQLPQRAGGATLPQIQCLDIRREPLQAGFSATLLARIAEVLQQGDQVLLFLNRRGYAPSLQCHDCGWVAECQSCDARLTLHLRQRQLRCHHCAAYRALPNRCPDCHSSQLLTTGVGTEQAERLLQQHFTQWPTYRVDSDSMRGRYAMEELAAQVNLGEPCLLLGTQMLTKGHHFPKVSLVAVMDADALLFSADFRGEERMAQLLTQVAGRAGRAGRPGQVILQTHHPDHPAVQAMLHQSYAEQAERLLAQRKANGLPPAGQLIMLRSDCVDAATGEEFLLQLRRQFEAEPISGCQLIGPLPSPMPRRQGRHRSQLMLSATGRPAALRAAPRLVALAEALPKARGLNWTIDVDPSELS
ncbi:primosomal protein N' [Parahaliea sp. F7430]|uniref:Replication restart protein PriA n=1 Tax=Sediminihaliea albiluteola TaxID=2758564 RepID=A0A7W2TXW9_9GAMM|nr:primosomal protein N' [Sediminihaliea albiluteola]MBA6413940.1 primosomal protein N' [Sediminihaliea albiluteola]